MGSSRCGRARRSRLAITLAGPQRWTRLHGRARGGRALALPSGREHVAGACRRVSGHREAQAIPRDVLVRSVPVAVVVDAHGSVGVDRDDRPRPPPPAPRDGDALSGNERRRGGDRRARGSLGRRGRSHRAPQHDGGPEAEREHRRDDGDPTARGGASRSGDGGRRGHVRRVSRGSIADAIGPDGLVPPRRPPVVADAPSIGLRLEHVRLPPPTVPLDEHGRAHRMPMDRRRWRWRDETMRASAVAAAQHVPFGRSVERRSAVRACEGRDRHARMVRTRIRPCRASGHARVRGTVSLA